jgi:hypothetical protein
MEVVIDFPGGARVDAHFGPYRGCINKTHHLPTFLYLSDISSLFAKYIALSQ